MEANCVTEGNLCDLINEGFKIIDTNYNIIFCNEKYAYFNNADNNTILGKKCYDYLSSGSCGSKECSLKRMLNGKEFIETVLETKTKSNTKYFILSIKPLKNENNDVVGIIECFVDITELKNTEIALKESEAKLKAVNAVKDRFFSIIAHDLRSPFNSILGFSELLIDNIKNLGEAEVEEFLRMINSSAVNTLSLLDNLLNWAKTQTGEIDFNPERIVLSTIIKEIIEISDSAAKLKKIFLNYIHSDDIEVYTDKNIVKTVLRNLISNAIKFTETGGRITVSAVPRHNQVEITIADNGVGMNEETRRKLFDMSTHITSEGTNKEKGSGLGLVLCKEFVEKLGGNIWVESEEGKGSDFKFTLPLNTYNKK